MSASYDQTTGALPRAKKKTESTTGPTAPGPIALAPPNQRLADLLSAPLHADRPAPVQPPLSPTERRVVRLLTRGMTEKQAGEAMGRSHNTVHVHVRNIYRKLGVSSRKMLYQLVDANPQLTEQDEPSQSRAA